MGTNGQPKGRESLSLRADKAARRLLLAGVHGYQRWLGWLLGGHCRFVPSCSCYAEAALWTAPLWRAVGLILWRLLRCQPLCRGGFDPVPERPGEERYCLGESRDPGFGIRDPGD